MNFRIIAAFLLACILVCREAEAQPVTITVNYENVVGNTIQFYPDDDLDWVGHVRRVVQAGDNGTASFMAEPARPGYYSLHHNTVYLSPGDELTANLSNYRNRSTFEGRGAEANNYLKDKSWPALKEGFEDFSQYKVLLDRRLAEACATLDNVPNVSDEFRRLERKSLRASHTGSVLDYALKGGKEYAEAHEVLHPLLVEITGDDEYLMFPQSQNIFTRLINNPQPGIEVSARARELYDASQVTLNLRERIMPEQYDEYLAFGQGIVSDDIRSVFMARLRKLGGLLPGRPAPDSDLIDRDGNPVKLSAYKGRPIYIDVWATWCGPCIAEGPHYRELCDKYPGIRFIAVSVDDDRGKWETYIEEHAYQNVTELIARTSSAFRDDWGISGIPHFILIDEDFKIVLPDAPRPRQDISNILDELTGR